MRLLMWAAMLFATVSAPSASELKIITHTATGGHYIHANILAKHLRKYLPDTKVVLQPMPGASGAVALNYIFNAAKRDGSEISTVHSRAVLSSLFKSKEAKYDIGQMEWLGSALDGRREPFVMLVRGSPDKIIAGSDASLDVNQFKIIKQLTGWDFEEVSGYKDAPDVKLAFDRGEVNAVVRSLDGIRFSSPEWLTDPNVRVVLQFGNGGTRHPSFPDTPTLFELTFDKSYLDTLKLFESYTVLARAFVAPPDTDTSKLKVLRQSFKAVLSDPDYRSEVSRFGVEVSPIDWQECQEIIQQLTRLSDTTIKNLQRF